MNRYELLYIVPATFAENEIQPVLDGVTKELTKLGAKITRNDMVGKLKLAYPIRTVRHGYFVLVDMELEADQLQALDKAFRLHTDVLRHQVVVKDEKAKPISRLTTVERIERERVPKKAERQTKERQAAAASKDREKAKVNMEEIDKKLDKIVEGNIL